MLMIMLTLRGRMRFAALASVPVAGLAVGLTKLDAIMGLQREGTVSDTRKSASMRGSFAYVSWKMFQDKPILGFGFGQFATAKLPYLADRSTNLDLESIRDYVHHNTFLSILIEAGLLGLLIFWGVIVGWNWSAWRLVRSSRAPPWTKQMAVLLLGVMGIAFWQMVGHEITFTPIDQSIIYFVAGCVVGMRATFEPPAKRIAVSVVPGMTPSQA